MAERQSDRQEHDRAGGFDEKLLRGTRGSWQPIFGHFLESGSGFRQNVAILLMLCAHPIAVVVLLIALNLAQCSWWAEPPAAR